MARALALANGELYVGLNQFGLVETLHFPYIGHDNHTPHAVHKIGVWVDGQISWCDDSAWTHRSRYPVGALIGHSVAVNEELGVLLEFEDAVEADANVLIRNVHVVNFRDKQRNIRLFFHQAFTIGGSVGPDTAQYVPADGIVLHYRGRRAFAIGGMTDVGQSFDQYAVGLFGEGLDGTWRDGEDGQLSMAAAECGQTDSTIGFSLMIGGLSSRRVHYWLAASTATRGAIQLSRTLRKQGVYKRLGSTVDWWRKSLTPAFKVSDQLDSVYRKAFVDSLLGLRSHIDRRGAIIYDATDPTRSICDPEVGALALWPLIRLGYKQEAVHFFTFIRQALTEQGFVSLAYHGDGSLAPTRLAYDGVRAPLRSSQTAVTLFIFSQLQTLTKQPRLLKDFYVTLVVPMANFLSEYVDERGLPLSSIASDGQTKESTSYTASLTYAALTAAAELADTSKDQDSAIRWRTAASALREAALKAFVGEDGTLRRSPDDETSDIASLYGAFMFGLIDMGHPAVAATVERLEREALSPLDKVFYAPDGQIDYVGSLRMAQYYLESGERDKAEAIVRRISRVITAADTPHGPLTTWVYGEFINTLLDMLTRN